jgi:hypothetical protein
MKKSLSIKIFFGFIVLLISFSSCSWFHKKQLPRGKNIICVVDFSDSKNSSERLQFYMHVIKDNIIPKLGLNDKITVIPIDMASITNSSDILLKDMSVIDFEPEMASPMELEQITNDNFKKYKDTLAISFEKNFHLAITNRNKTNNGTDIFGALEVVKGKLKTRDDNYIILLSDMMNWSSTLIMEPSNRNFNNSTMETYLKRVPNVQMPMTTVLVITGEQVEVSPIHYKLIQNFWTKYFENNQIKLYDYNSASDSKLNELMLLEVNQNL